MKLYLDNIIYSIQKIGGISIYWYELTNRFNTKIEGIKYITQSNGNKNLFFNKVTYNNSIKESNWGVKIVLRFLPLLIKLPPLSIFHSSYHRISLQKNVINILTIHDCAYERNIAQTGFSRLIHLLHKKFVIKRADGIICVSEHTKKDLLTYYPFIKESNVKVIYNGASHQFNNKIENFDTKDLLNLPSKYILFVGDRKPYKNFNFVVNVVKELSELNLVVAGGKGVKKEEKLFLEENIPNRYKFIENLSTENLNYIYKNAYCLVYPSLYEGFGIPPLEAMKSGCPVIVSHISSLPEVVGNAGIFLYRMTIEECIEKIVSLENSDFRNMMISRGLIQSQNFSWDECAEETLKFYKKIYFQKFHIHIE